MVVPVPTPVTMPVTEPMVAIEVTGDIQVPPGVEDKTDVPPTHSVVVPVIAAGEAFTVSSLVTEQPPGVL